MKVLHIIPSYIPARLALGPILPTHTLNRWLVQRGVEVTVYTTNIDGAEYLPVPFDKPVVIDGVRVHYFRASFPRAWQYSKTLHERLRGTVADFDVVHITSVFLAASALGAHYARRFGKPFVMSPHGSLMCEPLAMRGHLRKRVYLSLVEQRNLATASLIHFTSEAERDEYLAFKFPFRRFEIIPNAFDAVGFGNVAPGAGISFRKRFNIPEHAKVALILGRLGWKKGFDTLIPAFQSVMEREPAAILVIAGGDDGYRVSIEQLMQKFHIPSARVVFTGSLAGQEKVGAYVGSNAFVLPSYSENFAMVVAEAMHVRLPVVISDKVGIAPAVKRAGAGLVVPKNEKEVADAILRLFKNEKEAAVMGDAGRRLVEREFGPARVAEQFSELYNQIVKT